MMTIMIFTLNKTTLVQNLLPLLDLHCVRIKEHSILDDENVNAILVLKVLTVAFQIVTPYIVLTVGHTGKSKTIMFKEASLTYHRSCKLNIYNDMECECHPSSTMVNGICTLVEQSTDVETTTGDYVFIGQNNYFIISNNTAIFKVPKTDNRKYCIC